VTNAGQLDMGLLFVCFQSDLAAGFLAVQSRLNGERLEEYIKPVGGGYFFVLPGVQSKDDFFAEGLLRASA
jgi:deferrochelatase/peroxidase EfeB